MHACTYEFVACLHLFITPTDMMPPTFCLRIKVLVLLIVIIACCCCSSSSSSSLGTTSSWCCCYSLLLFTAVIVSTANLPNSTDTRFGELNT